jgi:hypothetical protein
MARIFVSHRGSDLAEATKLANELRLRGHDVWLDEWKIDLGDSVVAEIDSGLDAAAYVVLCYSSSGVHSPWMGREWMSTLARQLSGVNVKLLPVILTGGSPPAILADIKYVDLFANWSRGINQLCSVIV